jgi:cell division protein FtsI/penicillin-binding protein 2
MLTRRAFLVSSAVAQSPEAEYVIWSIAHKAPTPQSRYTSTRFHPGSIAKPVTAATALEHGPVPALRCDRSLRIGTRRLDCTHPSTPATLNLVEALAYSCNIYYTALARAVGPVLLAAGFRRFGLDAATPSNADHTALLGIGEWGLSPDLVDIAAAYAKLSGVCANSRFAPLLRGLELTTTLGTARLAKPAHVTVAGKTGTSPGRGRMGRNAIFAGWAPARHPQLVVVVRVPGGAGGTAAAPIARRLFEAHL